MLEMIVLTAEGLVVLWFVTFLTVMTNMYLEGRTMPLPKLEGAGLVLVQNAKIAFITGLTAVVLLTAWEIANALGRGGVL